ncbi:sunset domain-containing protein [Tolypothrix sp. VBCCA 56010]|uniref:sunset domain-containing protein n=1 Tax=Tolypothrix sp. VBCCA 56010 TaxID=3137731 RepID=UPI003D7EB67F
MNNLLKPRQSTIALALLAVLMLTSCGKKAEAPDADATASPGTTTASSTNDSGESGSNASIPAEAAKLGVKPTNATTCPNNALVKGKVTKKRGNIYHIANSLDYDKVKPDICFKDTVTAEKAGFQAPK